jgi:betaine reductase
VHYINQFYGGIGGEDKAGTAVTIRQGPVGPGRLLAQLLGDQAEVVGTLICGDNHFHENKETVVAELIAATRGFRPDVVVAGPAFASGRYGLACSIVCAAIEKQLGVPAICSMHLDNPACEQQEQRVYILPSASSAIGMADAVRALTQFALKLASQQPIGPAADEGYIPRGIRRNARATAPAANRVVDMLLKKLYGHPFRTELAVRAYDPVTPPAPIADLSKATIALVTEAGVVPKGNPDRIEAARATRWGAYSIAGLKELPAGQFESVHGGYDNTFVHEDPDRVLPVDALRQLEMEGVIGKLFDTILVTCGSVGNVGVMRRIGREMAAMLAAAKVDGVVLPAT